MKLSLLTLTCDRPLGFQLAEHYVNRQGYSGSYEWIVADGGQVPVECRMRQTHIRVSYRPDPKENFLANLEAGLEACTGDAVVFIEDDDWYSHEWLAWVANEFKNPSTLVCGEGMARYYNIQSGRYWLANNKNHASLCSTAIRSGECVDWVLRFIKEHRTTFVDMHLWRAFAGRTRIKMPASFVVGMKGIPGRAGIGIGHRLKDNRPHDATGDVLRSWIGTDADLYRDMVE